MRALVKVNLTLHVGAVRADGYHSVSSVCAFPAIGDEVTLAERATRWTLSVEGPEAGALAGLPPTDNLAVRAARLLASQTAVPPRRIVLSKSVPAAAGIAGGTADAAAVLVLLNREAAEPLCDAALIRLSRHFGADGPVCTAARLAGGGLWLAEGDGARVRGLGPPPPLWGVLANDRTPVPTGAVFRAFDAGPPGTLPQPAADLRTARGLAALCQAGRNDLRAPALSLAPGIGAVEAAMRAQPGCRAARMSGSGGTVFGLFADARGAEKAARRMRGRGHWAESGPLV